MGYRKFKDGYVERELAYLLPPDNALESLTFDPEILEAAVLERRNSGRYHYLSPDELSHHNLDWQNQCRIYEHLMDYGFDYNKVPKDFRA